MRPTRCTSPSRHRAPDRSGDTRVQQTAKTASVGSSRTPQSVLPSQLSRLRRLHGREGARLEETWQTRRRR